MWSAEFVSALSAATLVDAALFLSRNRVHRNHTFRAVQVHNVATGAAALLVVAFLVATMTFLAITEAGKQTKPTIPNPSLNQQPQY